MITIAQEHYEKMLNLIRLLSSNISLLHPEATELRQVLQQCQLVNNRLNELYGKLSSDLESILATNQQLTIENGELNGKIVAVKAEMATLVQTNTMQRSDLAKYLN
jgi:regulator of replication initiation timing